MTTRSPLTVNQAAEDLNVSKHTIRAWVASRRIGYLRIGRRSIRIPHAEVQRLLEQGFVPPSPNSKTR